MREIMQHIEIVSYELNTFPLTTAFNILFYCFPITYFVHFFAQFLHCCLLLLHHLCLVSCVSPVHCNLDSPSIVTTHTNGCK